MTYVTRLLLTALALLSLAPGARAEGLEVRVEPSETLYVNQTARLGAMHDVMVQSIAVINRSGRTVTFKELELIAGTDKEAYVTDRVLPLAYEERWKRLYTFYSDPAAAASQDSILLISRVVPKGVTLSPTLTLAPNTAVMVTKRVLVLASGFIPPLLRLRAIAVDANGAEVTGEATRKIERYKQHNDYIFPLTGRWYVAAASTLHSHHRIRLGHEFALDLIKIGDRSSSFRTDGATPQDYYAFGADVLAAADGTVVEAVDGIKETEMPRPGESRGDFADRVLGAMWRDDPTGRTASGNHVVIKHEGGEHSFYVHMKNGSVAVHAGDRVRQGQKIGAVGISGDGFEPHLHFAVSDSASSSYGQGLPILFKNVRPVAFSSSIDPGTERLFLDGEFVETAP